MACREVLFAIDQETADALLALDSDEARVEHIQEVIEEDFFENHAEWLVQTDKSWDWMHCALTDGELDWDNGQYPLNHVIMGGESLHEGSDYIITLKTPKQVSRRCRTCPDYRRVVRRRFPTNRQVGTQYRIRRRL